jgi:ADP-heptose:LPS heptosyltransferase/GT2 family glycosyltransferase
VAPENPDRPIAVEEELPLLMVVDVPAAGSTFSPGDNLAGLGWVLSKSSVAEISVSAGDTHLGYAAYGLHRPDLAEAFPQYPNADHAGFSFSASLDLAPAETVSLVVSVRTVDGEERRATIPIQIADPQPIPPGLDPPVQPGREHLPLEMKVDRAVIGPGGELQIVGWAVAGTPLECVRIFAGEALLGTADLGHARPDVAKDWPGFLNALTPGFSFLHALSASFPADLKEVKIEAVAQGGIRREVGVPITTAARAEADANILFHCDHIWLAPSGRLVISGWSTSPQGIEETTILFDGVQIGKAELGLPRADVALVFPTIAHAGQAGLAFTHQLSGPGVGEHVVTINLRAGNGAVRVVSLPVAAQAIPADIDKLLRLQIDSPALAGGAALVPVRGTLRIEGWALARVGTATIRAYIDDVDSFEAYCGLRREDVAAAHPDWDDALLSGFGISIPARRLSHGAHTIRVVLRDRLGRERFSTFTVTVDAPTETGWPTALRTRMSPAEIQMDRLVLSGLGWEPTFELYMTVRESEIEAARLTLVGLTNQEYSNWRLIVLVRELENLSEIGKRLLDGVPLVDSSVIVRAAGDERSLDSENDPDAGDHAVLCGLLRPGDRLGQDALLEMAIATGLDPQADFVYSDERRVDPASGRTTAYFKPNWSPDLLLSCNYIGRLWLARRKLLRRAGVEIAKHPALGEYGPGEYGMVLRLTGVADRIAHLPKVLCERGAAEFEDPETERAALKQAAQAMGVEAEILPGCAPGIYRFKRALRQPGRVSIIIPTCGAGDLVKNCIASIQDLTANQNFEIVCVENTPASETRTRRWLKRNADKAIRVEDSFNWSRFNNTAASAASPESEYLLFLNDDTEVFEPEWLDALLEHGQRQEVGVTGAMLLYPDRTIQHAGLQMVAPGRGRHASKFAPEDDAGSFGRTLTQRNVIAVTGACMLIRRSFFQDLGGFDEAHAVINNDLDLCLRSLDRGKSVMYTPYAKLIHHEMASRKTLSDLYDVKLFEKTWRRKFGEGDPYYNPFLSRVEDHFTTDLEPIQIIHGGHPLMHRAEVRAILAVKLDHIGDFITALPAFRHIKERFPQAKLCVLASTASVRLARLEPAIDEVIEFNFFNEKSSLGPLEISDETLSALRRRLASERFDIAIDLRKHPETRDLLRHAGAKFTAGFDSESRFQWLDIVLEWEKDFPLFAKRQHVADDLVRLIDAVVVACEGDRRTIRADAMQFAESEARPDIPKEFFDKPVVCVHPASGNALRTWPAIHFAELIELIQAEYDVNIAVIGGDGDQDIIQEMFAELPTPSSVLSLSGRIPMEQLPQFLARCALFVGNNSGPQHIAAGLGIPTVGVHSGVVDAREWAPIGPAAVAIRRDMTCSPCYLALPGQCTRRVACLTELRPGEVLATCRKLLAIKAGASRRTPVPAT